MIHERMSRTREAWQRYNLVEEKLGDGWHLPEELFPEPGADMHDFEEVTYVRFLDGVGTVENLRLGLNMLSPFADDAWGVANLMTEEEFAKFKALLPKERALAHSDGYRESGMPNEWYAILMPTRLFVCSPIAARFEVPLGAVLVRSVELEAEGLLRI